MNTEKEKARNQQAEGSIDKAKGKVKEAYGSLAGDNEKRFGGMADQAKGEIKKKVGEFREKNAQ